MRYIFTITVPKSLVGIIRDRSQACSAQKFETVFGDRDSVTVLNLTIVRGRA